MFSRSSSQDVKSQAKAKALQAKAGATQAKAQAIRAQELALQAKEQLTPLAKSAQQSASQGLYQARTWAAPRVEQAGVAVQERIAPAVSTAMITTARRMQPVQAKRRRWPVIVAGVVTVSAAAVAAILLRGQRANRLSDEPATDSPPPAPPASDQANSSEQSETAQADVNGQVRTP